MNNVWVSGWTALTFSLTGRLAKCKLIISWLIEDQLNGVMLFHGQINIQNVGNIIFFKSLYLPPGWKNPNRAADLEFICKWLSLFKDGAFNDQPWIFPKPVTTRAAETGFASSIHAFTQFCKELQKTVNINKKSLQIYNLAISLAPTVGIVKPVYSLTSTDE